MTNEEKAEKIVAKYEEEYNDPCNSLFDDFENIAIEMAEWKEQQMIKKACKWLKSNLITIVTDDYIYTASIHNISREEFIEQFKKAMEEQQ